MDLGLLLLRLLLGALLFGHGAQKMFGWFGGLGRSGTAPIFESWGLRPGKALVAFAALCEIVAAVLLVLGLATPLAAAAALGTMTVASSVNLGKGLWAQTGGYELPLVYAGMAAAIAFTGPGAWSADHVLGLTNTTGALAGAVAVVTGLLCAAAFIRYAAAQKSRAIPSTS